MKKVVGWLITAIFFWADTADSFEAWMKKHKKPDDGKD